jgi:hypothetical protein
VKQLAVLVLLSPLCLVAAGAASPTIVGSWNATATDSRNVQTHWKIVFTETAGKLAGELQGLDEDIRIPLIDPKFETGRFTAQIRINATELVQVSAKIDGDRFDGRFEGQQSGTGTLKATRVVAATLSGTWTGEWEVSPDGRPGPHYMILKQEGEKITGTVGPNEQQQLAIEHVKFANSHLTFDLVIPAGNGVGLSFDFTVNGDSMSGNALFKMNGTEKPLKLAVKRAK